MKKYIFKKCAVYRILPYIINRLVSNHFILFRWCRLRENLTITTFGDEAYALFVLSNADYDVVPDIQ